MSVPVMMLNMLLALLPSFAAGIFAYGMRALMIIVIAVGAGVLSELLWEICFRKPIALYDGSAVVTGMLVGMCMPATVPLWLPGVGSFFAVTVVRQTFGGYGKNFMNPAAAARCVLMISFPSMVSLIANPIADWKHAIFGIQYGGMIGAASVTAILIGLVYLIVRGMVGWQVPAISSLTFMVFAHIFLAVDGLPITWELCRGEWMFGLFFMATDPVTSPKTSIGRLFYSVFLGIVCALFAVKGDGIGSFAYVILLGNAVTPLIDHLFPPAVSSAPETEEEAEHVS